MGWGSRSIGCRDRCRQIRSLDLPQVRAALPAQLPVVGDVDRDVAELTDRPEHVEAGELHRALLGRQAERLLGGEVDLDWTKLLLCEFDGDDLRGRTRRSCCLVHRDAVAGRSRAEIVRALLNQLGAGRQSDAKPIEAAAIAAYRQMRIGANAVAVDRDRNRAGGTEHGGQLAPLARGGAPGQAKVAGQAVGDQPRAAVLRRFLF